MHLIVQETDMIDSAMEQADLPDEAAGKGAVEDDSNPRGTDTSLSGQLGHRDQQPMLKANDTDFPGPDAEAEHSGG
jgi:hypothetical protein